MIRAVDHINIVVSDLERSIRLYTDILNFRMVRRARLEGEWIDKIVGLKNVSADVAYIVASEGEPRIELLQYLRPVGGESPLHSLPNTIGLRHIALRVTGINAIARRLSEAGVKLFGDPVAVPADAVRHDAGQKTLLYFTDPDGVIVELAQYE